jgi:hypothetical protein
LKIFPPELLPHEEESYSPYGENERKSIQQWVLQCGVSPMPNNKRKGSPDLVWSKNSITLKTLDILKMPGGGLCGRYEAISE